MAIEQLVLVGGGIAGCSAALEAAKLGLRVTLIDEHPQSLSAMSLDSPYFYGARLAPVLSDQSLIGDRVLGSNDMLLECLEAGVEILTGTCIWGSYRAGANSVNMKTPQLGLADADRSWMMEYDHLILAPGSRDLVLSFPGWQLPGVLGVNGAMTLLNRYQALSGSRMVILGTGNVALGAARVALDKGVQIAAIVDVAPEVRGDPDLAADLVRSGVAIILSHTVERILGEREVQAIRVIEVDRSLNPIEDNAREIPCDTVCMAFGVVPNVELPSVTGCRLVFDAARGGWVPALDGRMRTNLPSVYVIGDAAGVSEKMHLDPGIAADQGRRAAQTVAIHEGLLKGDGDYTSSGHRPASSPSDAASTLSSASEWLRSLVAAGGTDVIVCQCEDVTRRELLDISPPKYLGAGNQRACGGLSGLSPTGRSNQDLIKRLTRVGMGHCQGKRCRDQTAMLLANAAGIDISMVVPGSYRAPVRPLPLSVMRAGEETEEMRQTWPTWFHPLDQGSQK